MNKKREPSHTEAAPVGCNVSYCHITGQVSTSAKWRARVLFKKTQKNV